MHIPILSQQITGWLGGKGVDVHPWASKFNPHKWHGLWSMMGVDQILPTY
jgi:hypothetical protein